MLDSGMFTKSILFAILSVSSLFAAVQNDHITAKNGVSVVWSRLEAPTDLYDQLAWVQASGVAVYVKSDRAATKYVVTVRMRLEDGRIVARQQEQAVATKGWNQFAIYPGGRVADVLSVNVALITEATEDFE